MLDRIQQSYLKGTPEENEVSMVAGLCSVHPDIIHELTTANYRQLEDQFLVFTAPPSARGSAKETLIAMRAEMREASLNQYLTNAIFSGE